jgi:cytochrome c biogenesis protein CcmG, thiol:disulfide interchange protein DsbE
MKFLKVRALAASLLVACLTAPALAVDVGQPVPDIDLPGSSVGAKLSDLKGKVLYVDFWASWCGPCKQSFPWMNDMQKKYGAKGLQIVGMNVDAKREDADNFLKELPAQFAVAFDSKGESAKRFAIKGMPTAVLVGKDGKVLMVHQGFREQDRAELEAKLNDALNK